MLTQTYIAPTASSASAHMSQALRSLLLKVAARAKTDGLADYIVRYNPYIRGRIRRTLHSLDTNAGLEEKLTAHALHAAHRTRYGAGQPELLSDWPVLDKETIRTVPQDFVRSGSLLRIPASTGGTSGIPLKLWRSLESIVAEGVFIDDVLAPYGLSMRQSRVAVLRADTVKAPEDKSPPYGRISHGGKRLTLSTPHLNPQTLRWFYDALVRFEPSIVWVYPSALANLLVLLKQADLSLAIPVVLASSEMLSGSVHRAAERHFGCTVINYYGQAERVCFAYGTKPDEFFFNPLYGRVELCDAQPGREKAETTVKIIGTAYWNEVMPLVRYNTGDLLYVPTHYREKELAEIAAGKRPFTGLAGREGEYVITREGMRIIGLNQIPREVAHVLQLQLVQTDFDTLNINVLATAGFNAKDATRIKEQARAKLPHSFHITVKSVKRLKTTAMGKAPFVIRTFG